jgi:hypothetical protein
MQRLHVLLMQLALLHTDIYDFRPGVTSLYTACMHDPFLVPPFFAHFRYLYAHTFRPHVHGQGAAWVQACSSGD